MKARHGAAGILLLLLAGSPPAAAAEPGLPPPTPDYTRAYVAGGLGVALTGLSFWLADEADQAYDAYLSSSDPDQLESYYDEAVTYDRLASGALIVGQACLVLGVYWRFLRSSRGTSLAPASRAPRLQAIAVPGGLALQLRF